MNPLLWLIQLPFRKGQRRWDRAHPSVQTPAPPPLDPLSGGGAGPHPVPGQQASPTPAHGRPSAPAPRPAPAPAPKLDHDCGPVDIRISLRRGGCIFVWDRRSGTWRQSRHCGRPPFNVAEWEAKLQ